MKKIAIALWAAALLAACGTTTSDRALSGAGIGAGIGLLGGPPGVLIGAAVGGAAGAVTRPDQIDLGRPIWRA
jgi:osmotically inducible lipoprotein OsmB